MVKYAKIEMMQAASNFQSCSNRNQEQARLCPLMIGSVTNFGKLVGEDIFGTRGEGSDDFSASIYALAGVRSYPSYHARCDHHAIL
jgi:hypothetical protein